MKYFLFRLIPPRRTFITDMTDREHQLMQEHAVYWSSLMTEGQVIAFGPVADPKYPYGVALLRLEDGRDPVPLAANDPTIRAKAGFSFEVHPMLSLVFQEHPA